MTERHENVVYFTVDQNYLPMALANASALVDEEPRNFDVVIFLEGDNASQLRIPAGARVLPNDLKRSLPGSLVGGPWGTIVYTRIFAPTLLAAEYRRALYVDADIGVFGPVSPLFDLDMKGRSLAAIEGMMTEVSAGPGLNPSDYKAALGLSDGRAFNSGVLLIDIGEWNRRNHAASLRAFGEDVQPRLLKNFGFVLPDQDYLNFAHAGEWLALSPRWNFQTSLLSLALEGLFDPVIVHYVGPRRPWHELLYPNGIRHSKYFKEHLRRIGFTDFAKLRPRYYYPRFFADHIRQFSVNHIRTAAKREMFAEWSNRRAIFKKAIEARLRAGQFVDVEQGISAIDLSADPYADATIDDVVYYRKQVRLRSTL